MTLLDLTAGDLMTKDIVTIGRDETLRQAALAMTQRRIHCLIVPNPDPRRSLGVITMKDIVQVLCEGSSAVVDQLCVRDVMSTPAICVQRDSAIHDCIRLMRGSGVRAVPVLHATTPVGLLSFTDVIRRLANDPG